MDKITLIRGVYAMGNSTNSQRTVALFYGRDGIWLRFGGDSYPLTKEEVRELAKVFRSCVEKLDRAEGI